MNLAQAQAPSNLPDQAAQVLPLRDIKLPVEPGFWPLAPGWWLLIIVLIMLIIWLGFKWYRFRVKKRQWQAINQQLSDLEFAYQQDNDKQQLLSNISVFLRRFVKFQLKQNQASTLAGDSWIQHLNRYDQAHPFATYEEVLSIGVYQSSCEYDAQGLLQITRDFIQKQVMKPMDLAPFKVSEPPKKEQHHV